MGMIGSGGAQAQSSGGTSAAGRARVAEPAEPAARPAAPATTGGGGGCGVHAPARNDALLLVLALSALAWHRLRRR